MLCVWGAVVGELVLRKRVTSVARRFSVMVNVNAGECKRGVRLR